jgi:streptogramin lyase
MARLSINKQQGLVTRSFLTLSLVALLVCVSACSAISRTQTSNENRQSQNSVPQQAGTLPATLIKGNFAEYPLPQQKSGLMRPAVDHEGRVWVAEMGNNALAVFDPRTQTFQQLTPPHARDGLMGVLIAPDDTVWYSEQFANYIGRYDPAHDRYQEFTLPSIKIPDLSNKSNTLMLPSAPNDLAIDTHGNIWFTEMNTDSIGKLAVQTGHFTHYPLSPLRTVQKYSPYGITVDRQNSVWFTEASTNNLGRLDPATGTIQYFTLPGPSNPLMEVASDSHGTIWATTFNSATLLKFDPQHATFSIYHAPNADKGISGMYGLTVTPLNEIWVTIAASNTIARFDANAKCFFYYQIPTENSSPLGVAYSSDHTIWFTESIGNQVGKLKL